MQTSASCLFLHGSASVVALAIVTLLRFNLIGKTAFAALEKLYTATDRPELANHWHRLESRESCFLLFAGRLPTDFLLAR